MIENYQDYEDFTKTIVKKVPLLKTDQLILLMANYFKQDASTLNPVLFALQSMGVIFMTVDGWTMTIGEYQKLTGDRFLQNRYRYMEDDYRRLPEMDRICRKINKPLVESLWLVADMMPDAKDFVVAGFPWTVSFLTCPTETKDSLLYEITYIPKGLEYAKTELLTTIPKIQSNHVKDIVRRVCILEDESYAWRVPRVGFSVIVVIDHSRVNHFRVVEKRTDKKERWADDPYHD